MTCMKERENQNRRLDLWHNRATSTNEGGEMTKFKPLNPDAITIEEAFFAQENAKLLERLRQEARVQERREAARGADSRIVQTPYVQYGDSSMEFAIASSTGIPSSFSAAI